MFNPRLTETLTDFPFARLNALGAAGARVAGQPRRGNGRPRYCAARRTGPVGPPLLLAASSIALAAIQSAGAGQGAAAVQGPMSERPVLLAQGWACKNPQAYQARSDPWFAMCQNPQTNPKGNTAQCVQPHIDECVRQHCT
jgi:hypothetical protein